MKTTGAFFHSFFTPRVVLLSLAVLLGLGLTQPASAQNNLVDDSGQIGVNYLCDNSGEDDCLLESFAVLYDDTTPSSLDALDQTSVSMDSFDDGWDAFVCGYIYQDGVLYASGCASDDGSGVAAVGGTVAIDTTNGPHDYSVVTDSYYDYYYDGGCEGGGTCVFIVSTQVVAAIGPPRIDSVSPPYVFVGTSGSLTLNGNSFINPFGGDITTLSTSNGSGTGFTVTKNTATATQVTANYSAALTATTGYWSLGLSYTLGGTILKGVFGSFIVGDPPPSISTVSPNQWTAGQDNFPVTISGSYFGSNPQLTLVGGGATASITSHTDTGQPNGATINASVSVPNACDASGSVTITVTSTGYNGSGFTAAYPGESSSATSSATIVPVPGPSPAAPQILFGGKNVAGATTNVVVGQQIMLTGNVPSQACVLVQNWNWTPPTGTAVGGATATTQGGFTLAALPSSSNNPYTFYWVYPGTFTISTQYTLVNGETSPVSTATFKVKGLSGATDTATSPYGGQFSIDTLKGCSGIPGGPNLVYGNVMGPQPGCSGTTTGTTGILFTASGSQPGTGNFLFVQLLTTDTTTYTSSSGTETCTTTAGIDKNYPYQGQPTPTTATDAPETPLPSTKNTVNRVFQATMYLIWQSTTASSIPFTIGFQSWGSNGTATQTKGKWKASGSGAPQGKFTAASAGQPNMGYPSWPGPANQSCK